MTTSKPPCIMINELSGILCHNLRVRWGSLNLFWSKWRDSSYGLGPSLSHWICCIFQEFLPLLLMFVLRCYTVLGKYNKWHSWSMECLTSKTIRRTSVSRLESRNWGQGVWWKSWSLSEKKKCCFKNQNKVLSLDIVSMFFFCETSVKALIALRSPVSMRKKLPHLPNLAFWSLICLSGSSGTL